MPPTVLLSGFGPFGGERVNPAWEIARRLEGKTIDGLEVKAVRLPVDCSRAARAISHAIERFRPAALLSLGQAGDRPQLSLERVALNIADRGNAAK